MTLTQTAVLVKQIITISVVALILGIAGFVGYQIWHAYYLAHLPPPLEKPDTKFGLLPPPDFPQSLVSTSNFSYSLDTTTGGLPKMGVDPGFEKIIKVYFVTRTFASFLSPERSQTLAQKFGISASPQVISETEYSFKDNNKTLVVNLDSGNFSYINEATVSAKENPDDDQKLVDGFEQILSSLGILKEDLKNGRSKVTFLKADGGKLITTNLRTEAQAARISLWPSPLDKKPILNADFNQSLINATLVKSANSLENYLSLYFTYYPIDTTTFATYPTKTADEAFNDLKSGRGVVVVEPLKPQVSITSVYLGYYLSGNYSPYLQPIFIFEGPNFVAYVPAVSQQFIAPAR